MAREHRGDHGSEWAAIESIVGFASPARGRASLGSASRFASAWASFQSPTALFLCYLGHRLSRGRLTHRGSRCEHAVSARSCAPHRRSPPACFGADDQYSNRCLIQATTILTRTASSSARTDFVLDALEQALHARKPVGPDRLIHHSDRGVQYVSIRYTERPAEAGLEPSVGSVGDSYDNAPTECTRPKSSIDVHPGAHAKRWNGRRCSGSTGSTTAPPRADRQHPASRGRGSLLCPNPESRHRGVTHTNEPPRKPGRFSSARCPRSPMVHVAMRKPYYCAL